MNLAQGVSSLASGIKKQNLEDSDVDDKTYMTSIYGKHLSGWDGQNRQDLASRNMAARTEVLNTRPKLLQFVMQIDEAIQKSEGGRIDTDAKVIDYDNKKLDKTKKFMEIQKMYADVMDEELADVEDEASFNRSMGNLKMYGVRHSIPDWQTFAQNPDAYRSRAKYQKKQLEKSLSDIDEKLKKSQLGKAQEEEKQAQIGTDFLPAEKRAGLRKTDAETNKKNLSLTINELSEDEQASLANAIQNGFDPYKVNSRNAKIIAHLDRDTGGQVKWNTAAANAIYERAIGTQNTQSIMTTIDPLLDNLKIKGKELRNTRLPFLNKGINAAKEASGDPEIVAFNNARDDAIAELERGLLGTGVLSDNKYQRALKNVNSAQSYPQLEAAVEQMKIVISSRLEAIGNQMTRDAGLNPGTATAASVPKTLQPGQSFTHPNGVTIQRIE